jgi:transposase
MGLGIMAAADFRYISNRKGEIIMATLRIIGIDLAVTAAHRAIVLDSASNQYVSHVISFHSNPAEIDQVLSFARSGAPAHTRLIAVLEATNMAWFTVGTYLHRRGVEVYRVNGRQTADQRKVYHRHAKSDRIDARVLPKLYLNAPDRINRLFLPEPDIMELQRLCREVTRLSHQIGSSKNRLLAIDNFAWLGFTGIIQPYDAPARWLRRHWYDPWRVYQVGTETLKQAWLQDNQDPEQDLSWIEPLVAHAQQVIAFYGEPAPIDYQRLQAFLTREQARLEQAEAQRHWLQLKQLRPLYRQIYPQRYLESIPGVGQDSAATYVAFVGDIHRFPSLNDFLGWSGMIPFSNQSGEGQSRGLHITQAGPDLLKRTAFLTANVARLYDPQIAAVYYDQMINKGKHHLQAVCACATHLLTRVYVVLRENRPLELRDVDGTPVSKQLARAICQERYKVPEEVRIQNNHRVRTRRAEQRLEMRTQRRQVKQRSKG